ncbi:MAG: hypothetical protein K9N09_00020 [Candidatus Cloacimonetes bacterium]|nr:hypothetical protein [Candidatus Cloacimonadota bacterium]MCF7812847.1 hypothetical protein [Candidatus Cloacimonadota bacterium]MCF7867059.1 hypothetical protein [Candidatus Cloacimonadota bacterium]MCF7882621.1 hypothetical protein [Candidatus Cloacimonadota bacterium]
MNLDELNVKFNQFKYGDDAFHELMQKKIKNILLVSTFYDAYIFEQDGRLSEQLHGEYMQLNLSTAPRVTSVPTGQKAIEMLKKKKYDLVITMMRIGEVSPFELSDEIKKLYPDLPVLLLLNVASDLGLIDKNSEKMQNIENVFIWHGDSKIFLSMVKYLEDKWNVANDTEIGHVRVVLLVEDSIQYYSKFHPVLYSVILKQTQRLIGEELNEVNKRQRMRARPKVLLCHSFEEAIETYERYRDFVSAIISDTKYSCNNVLDPKAGIKLIEYVKKSGRDCPIILQSSDIKNAEVAKKFDVYFLHKNSKKLLNNLSRFIVENLGFGDFIFRDKQGNEINRATSLEDFEEKLAEIPDESLLYHGKRNHFSSWLAAHSEFHYARKLKAIKVDDFNSADEIRSLLLNTFIQARKIRNKGKIINFDPQYLDIEGSVVSLAEGSFGGKGRGLSFLNYLITSVEYDTKYENVKVRVPKTFIIGTREFDDFIESNDLSEWVNDKTDDEIKDRFIESELSDNLTYILRRFLQKVNYPITVRSSGLLEDSQSQPFAGVYDTFMLPNNHPEIDMRIKHLSDAIKLVFSSVFISKARNYIESIHYKVEEEKMAVIIQEIVGHKTKDELFFPLFSGAAQSYNFYPSFDTKHQDGIAALAIGLGRSVVDGERVMRFCPTYPRIDLMKAEEIVANNQQYFYAVNLNVFEQGATQDEDSFIKKIDITSEMKEKDFKELTSLWDHQHLRFVDGEFMQGARMITFRNQIHYGKMPIPEILQDLLQIGEISFGIPVEIEFAVDRDEDNNTLFSLLQIRPLTVNKENVHVEIEDINRDDLLLFTSKGMGNGIIENIEDIIFVNPLKFDNTQTLKIADEIFELNKLMQKENREYILIGPGRWGTSDRFLGIPVRWEQINKARVIVETSLKNFTVEASQGSHFFHNLVAMNVAYFTVSHTSENDKIDWNWLLSQSAQNKRNYVSRVKLKQPISVQIDGRTGNAIITK